MARKNQENGQNTAKDQFNAYKKEIGKQYMDGLISDKEYEKLLHQKENELGLKTPAKEVKEGPECPSCGALINGSDTECMICGVALVPILETEELPAQDTIKVPDNWKEEWIDKPFRHMSPQDLLKQPPDVLKGVSKDDATRMAAAFNIKTLEKFATIKYLAWAQELAALKDKPNSYKKEDFKHRLIKEYENKPLDEILKAPTYALQGVSESDSKKLTKSFNTKTIEELGNLKFIIWANRIYEMANKPRIYRVGDKVLLPSGQRGKVISVTAPDISGHQKVEVAVV